MKVWLGRHSLFAAVVLAPTIFAAIYYGFIASNVFISESRFVVRSPQSSAPAGFVGAVLQGAGLSRSQDDTYSVHDYVLSRDALQELDQTLGVRRMYSSKSIDFINRFARFGWNNSFEDFYRYYGNRVGVEYDPVSSISILTVRAFRAEDARQIDNLLLEMSERLVNALNERSRQDLIRFADDEITIASDKAKNAALALLAYRSAHAIFEPDKEAVIQLEAVAKIQEELVSTEADLAQLKKLSPGSPQISALNSRADTLRDSIASEASKVTSGTKSLSARAPDFQRLTLELEFADKQLGAALAAFETARGAALQKQLYLERLVQPSLPDKAMEPRRLRSVFTVFALGMICFAVASLVLASVREHSE
jgi:capsular polysaccharide transport system permease protein